MKCFICNQKVLNDSCNFCNIRFNTGKSIQDRHCWNLEDYKSYLKIDITHEKRKSTDTNSLI